MSLLNKESGFDDLVEIYQKNKDKNWDEWLDVKSTFPRTGKQGLVGLMKIKGKSLPERLVVFKVSQYINYLVQHELAVMKSLNEISDYCPHFCRAIGGIICQVDPMKRKEGNPFKNESKYPIEKEVLLMEYLQGSYKFCNYILSDKIPEDILYSTVKQTLLAISIAQRKKNITHYDLHSNNIMMKKCNKNLVFLYVLDETNQFCVATHGHYPVIIDFGFSYSRDMDEGPLWPSLNHTDIGFTSDRFDPVADPKLFLVTVSDEINEQRKSKRSRKLKNIAKNIYGSLNINWSSGWDKDTGKCATDYITALLGTERSGSPGSKLFRDYEYFCMDILQSLIIIPLEKEKYNNLGVSYRTFVGEFSKIEKEIGPPFYCLYILKGVVDIARTVRADYRQKETRKDAVNYFRHAIYERIDSVAKYCKPKDVHFEKMLCSLLCLGKCMEGVLFETMDKQSKRKEKLYKSLPLKTPEEICAVIDINIEETYTFSNKTVLMVIDCIKESISELSLTETQINNVNSYESISRGAELYGIYTGKNVAENSEAEIEEESEAEIADEEESEAEIADEEESEAEPIEENPSEAED